MKYEQGYNGRFAKRNHDFPKNPEFRAAVNPSGFFQTFGKGDKEGAHHENTKGIGCPRKDQSRIRIDKAKFKNFNVEREP